MSASANGQGSTISFDRHTYEDPFLDMASTMLPKSFRKLQELCQIFAMQHPQIGPIIWRLAEYAITSIVYNGSEEAVRQNKEVFDKELQILDRGLEWGLDYYTYGNAFVTVSFPFERFYECKTCGHKRRAKDVKYTLRNNSFDATCPSQKCQGAERAHEPHDVYLHRAKGINIIRLEPMLITPKYNRATGVTFYYYDMPADIKASVKANDRDIIDSTPISYLKAIFSNTKLKLKRVFHFKRPTVSGRDMQWGLPLVMPALKDAYLNQIYKKSDEMVASEHSVPLRIMYPEPGTQDPLAKLSLGSFRQFMDRSIQQWRRDKNAIITAPLPVGVKVIGGDQGAYQTIQARQFVVDEIISAMGVTKGFVMGGEQWSAASINQRILENSFTNYLRRFDVCLQWVAEQIQQDLGLPPCVLTMKSFKKVDDIQQLSLVIQMARENRVSWQEALSRMDIDARGELKKIEEEASGYLKVLMDQLVSQAEAGAKSAIVQTQSQADAEGASEMLMQRRSKAQLAASGRQGAKQLPAQDQEAPAPAPAPAAAAKGRGPAQEEATVEVRTDGGGGAAASEGPVRLRDREMAQAEPQATGRFRINDQVEQWSDELLSLPEAKQRQMLQRMMEDAPDMAEAVSARASEKMFEAEYRRVIEGATSPEEIAQRLSMLPPKQNLGVQRVLRRENPQLSVSVLAAMAQIVKGQALLRGKAPAGGGAGGEGIVDMRPLPEQKPPRRTNTPV